MDSLKNHTQYYNCIGYNGDQLVVGSSGGDLIQFRSNMNERENKPDKKRVKAHQLAVTNISSTNDGFVSSSNDCFKIWNSSMRCMLSINQTTLGTKYPISSICWAKDMILVGTSGNEIWQLSPDDGSNLIEDGKSLVSSHAPSSPMGLSVHPNGTFATCGDDGILRIWNAFDYQENKSIDLDMPARSCAFSPDAMIAVGFGKPVKDNARTINGKWVILSMSDNGDYQIIAERRDVKKFVSEMKWHGNGDRLAVGSGDKKICVYGIATETKPAIKVDITLLSMVDLTSPVIRFDFSRDGKYLRANYECNELHFFEAGPGLHIKEPSRLKDTQWETETCIDWNVQGILLQDEEAETVSLDCSTQYCPTIVSGDSHGRLKMHQFPCTSSNAQYTTYPAHLGPVGKVRWIPGGYVVSTGETDGVSMIWRQEVDEGFSLDNVDAVPATAQLEVSTSPTSSEETCHSAVYDLVGQIIYPTSGICVIFDKKRNCHAKMDSFQKHEATVSTICTSHSRQLLASSDEKTIRVWDSQTCTEVVMLSDDLQQLVSVLSFSPNDAQLVSVSSDGQNQIICVWQTLNGEWNDAYLGFHTLAGREKVHFCMFITIDANQTHLVSGGRKHVNFWTEQNSTLVLSKGVLSKQCIHDTFLCGVPVDEKIVTGTNSGSFVVWEDKKMVKEIQEHDESVSSLCACPEGLISGCAKGIVILWSKTLQKVASFDVASSSSSPLLSRIFSIDITPHTNRSSTMKILVRTQSGEILEISCVTGNIISLVGECDRSDQVPTVALNPNA
ncbi:hypothetical protein ACHAXR_007473 [Thalassiosira sp. AJA248-18]